MCMVPDIVSLGEPLFELRQRNSHHGGCASGFGGDTSSFVVAAARQGAKVGYVTRIGEDPPGDAFMQLWESEGVDTSHVIRDPRGYTGLYIITYSEKGHAFSYFRKGSAASRLEPADLPKEWLATTKLLHVSGISQAISDSACDTVFSAIATARSNGVMISYDPNLRLQLWSLPRARAIIMEGISQSDICFPSMEDAISLVGSSDPEMIVDAFLAKGARTVVLKMGSQGAFIANQAVRQRLKGVLVRSVDETGAGDTFAGAFIAELINGSSLFEAARYANAAAALSTRGYGAVDPIPRRRVVETFLRKSMNVIP